jgi:hypothetical protein
MAMFLDNMGPPSVHGMHSTVYRPALILRFRSKEHMVGILGGAWGRLGDFSAIDTLFVIDKTLMDVQLGDIILI